MTNQKGSYEPTVGERRIRTARRTMTYIVRTLLFIIMGFIVCIAAFLTAERVSNLYILTSEGMALRAECILADGSENDLEEYFTLTFLESDTALLDTTYERYTISSYNYDLSIERVNVLPWSMSATVTAVERVSLSGSINADQLGEGESAADYPLPAWQSARYRIRFLNDGGRWYISALELVQTDPETRPEGTPDPNMSPIPMATPTPEAADAP
ncbi:MAG: hypothetical protein Q4C13_03580 [Clostridia bacterium]|nr:hypothetical protein [Clostridia bacterium]